MKGVDRYICIEEADVNKSIQIASNRSPDGDYNRGYNQGAIDAFNWIKMFGRVRNIKMDYDSYPPKSLYI